MRQVRKEADLLNEHPEQAGDVMLQIRRILPAEGCLTERMAHLRAKAHRVREGHVARLEETKDVFRNMPIAAKKKAAADLTTRYNQLIGIDTRLKRLDKTVAEIERGIRELTQRAQTYTANYEHKKLCECLKGRKNSSIITASSLRSSNVRRTSSPSWPKTTGRLEGCSARWQRATCKAGHPIGTLAQRWSRKA